MERSRSDRVSCVGCLVILATLAKTEVEHPYLLGGSNPQPAVPNGESVSDLVHLYTHITQLPNQC